MTAADYTAIRHRLDHPQVVIWDPCAATLAAEDPEWPAPTDLDAAISSFERLSASCVRRCLLNAGVLLAQWDPEFADLPNTIVDCLGKGELRYPFAPQPTPDDLRLRRALGLHNPPATRLLDNHWEHAPRFEPGSTRENAHLLARAASTNDPAVAAILLARVAMAVGRPRRFLYANGESRVLRIPDPAAFWARCRALLPIADVTTAEIEWGDVALPPRPLADDLPGGSGRES